jgi:hypothetical protein
VGTIRGEPKAGAELDALVLELVMGWQWVPLAASDRTERSVLWDPKRPEPESGDFRDIGGGRLLPPGAPHPSADANQVRDVEERIADRRLEYPYTVALTAIVAGPDRKRQDWREAWAVARATPEQRCRAALRAVGLTIDDRPPTRPTGKGLARPKLAAHEARAPL